MRILIAGAALLAGMSSTLVSAEEVVCGEDGGTTTYQEVVNSGCTAILGSLYVTGAELTNVDGLSNLTSAGYIRIRNSSIKNIDGLSNLTSAQALDISGTKITNVDALSSLAALTQTQATDVRPNDTALNLYNMPDLTNIDGLKSLTNVEGNVYITANQALTNLDGFKNLTTLNGFQMRIYNNDALTSIDGLKNLDTVSNLTVVGNDLLGDCGPVAPLVELLVVEMGAEAKPRPQANGFLLVPKVEGKLYGGNANSGAGCIEDYMPQTSSERVADLIETTTQMNLANGIANAYDSKLTSAFSALDDTNMKNDGAAFNKLYAFINSVEAQRGGKLTDSEADLLIASAMRVIDSLTE